MRKRASHEQERDTTRQRYVAMVTSAYRAVQSSADWACCSREEMSINYPAAWRDDGAIEFTLPALLRMDDLSIRLPCRT